LFTASVGSCLQESDLEKAQLGLGHSYSRAKVKFNVNRVDNMVIQAIFLLDTLDKDINSFYLRVREWYSWHFPELVKIVNDNYLYAKIAKFVVNKSDLAEKDIPALADLVGDEDKAKEIVEAAKASMARIFHQLI
jgi:nucleolar protein 56